MQLEPLKKKSNRLSLTPLIDVVFLLLIFFMLASTFKNFNTMPIAASAQSSTPSKAKKIVLLRLDDQGEINLNGQTVTQVSLIEAIDTLATEPEMVLVIRPSAKTPLRDLVRTLELARQSKLNNPVITR